MISPFTRINTATIRAERRDRLISSLTSAAIFATLIVLFLIVADMALTTALALPETLARAETLKVM